MITQLLAGCGSLLVLVAYAANVMSRLAPADPVYGFLNVLGAGLLATAGVLTAVWGFVALEGTWVIVSLIVLVRVLRRQGEASRRASLR